MSELELEVNQENDQEELNLEDENPGPNQRIELVTDLKIGMTEFGKNSTFFTFLIFDHGKIRFCLGAVWQCQFVEQNRVRDANHHTIVINEMIVIFLLIEKREEEIDLKIVRNEDVIEGESSVFRIFFKYGSVKIVINDGIAIRVKIVMAKNEDEEDVLFQDLHELRKSLLVVMVSLPTMKFRLKDRR